MNLPLRRAWLPFLTKDVPSECDTPAKLAAFELETACATLGGAAPALREEPCLGEGYRIEADAIAGGPTGLLYGAYAWILARAAGEPLPAGEQRPFYALRMLDCWDNADGSIERGYAGRSLWFEGGRMAWDERRIRQLGRMLASAGLNVLCVNNVNVYGGAALLLEDFLPDLARFAALLRPFGVRLMVSIDFPDPSPAASPRRIRWTRTCSAGGRSAPTRPGRRSRTSRAFW